MTDSSAEGAPYLHNSKFIYSYSISTREFFKTNVSSGKDTSVRLDRAVQTMYSWAETPREQIYLTGGQSNSAILLNRFADYNSAQVFCIDTPRDFAPKLKQPMNFRRVFHSVLFYENYIYAIGGFNKEGCLKDCERYSIEDDQWAEIEPLPVACQNLNSISFGSELYVVGLEPSAQFETVQKYSFTSMTW
eukprot:CAMPEP_0204897808 /NCGR_PEP_ID=MMETSP1397-20131031/938_1 /ASSEMBLY_ACC=CAM_ASM_000891 /TAXON_ID=49980 /ORGANISM="Climacostomum Climacostomum virens, Strain Stock W-24" /LENGTH=189 /DNA_ID=CAMNT_0052065585 /DNA_START=161 /DNA_END=727 /DNA_ORIENTATION=-